MTGTWWEIDVRKGVPAKDGPVEYWFHLHIGDGGLDRFEYEDDALAALGELRSRGEIVRLVKVTREVIVQDAAPAGEEFPP